MSVDLRYIPQLHRWVARTAGGVFLLEASPALRRLRKDRRYRGLMLRCRT